MSNDISYIEASTKYPPDQTRSTCLGPSTSSIWIELHSKLDQVPPGLIPYGCIRVTGSITQDVCENRWRIEFKANFGPRKPYGSSGPLATDGYGPLMRAEWFRGHLPRNHERWGNGQSVY